MVGCGISIPPDPDGTLERVSGGTLRVGATANGKWVSLGQGQEPLGIEPSLEATFDYAMVKAAIALLTKYRNLPRIRRAGKALIATWLRKQDCYNAAAIAAKALEAATCGRLRTAGPEHAGRSI